MDFLVTFFFLVSAHHFDLDFWPWKTHKSIRLILNYAIGTIGMLSPFIWWLYQRNETEIIIKLLGFVIAAGLAPIFSHGKDHTVNQNQNTIDHQEHVKLLEEQLQERRNEA